MSWTWRHPIDAFFRFRTENNSRDVTSWSRQLVETPTMKCSLAAAWAKFLHSRDKERNSAAQRGSRFTQHIFPMPGFNTHYFQCRIDLCPWTQTAGIFSEAPRHPQWVGKEIRGCGKGCNCRKKIQHKGWGWYHPFKLISFLFSPSLLYLLDHPPSRLCAGYTVIIYNQKNASDLILTRHGWLFLSGA